MLLIQSNPHLMKTKGKKIHYFFLITGLIVFSSLTGCATYSPSADMLGLSSEAVIQRLGPPTLQISEGGGSRLVFARGPFGKHTYFMYFSHEDKLIRSEQVLTEANFFLVQRGMTKQEVLNLIGPSKIVMGGGKASWTVWSYRYENSLCRWFQVEFKSDGLVKTAEYGRPPECNIRAPRAAPVG